METIRIIREGGYGGGERGRLSVLVATLSPPYDDSCVKRGCGDQENHFNVSLVVRDKVTRQCTQTGGLFAYQPSTLPLGQTGSRLSLLSFVVPIEMERK